MPKQQPTPELPPAGYSRDEELKIREDALAEAGETKAAQLEVESLNPKAFRVENELAQHFDELEVQGALDDYAYSWVPVHTTGRFVQQKLYKGWEVVSGEMPEAKALKSTDTTRKLGDVILMRIRREKKEALDRREEYKKIQQEEGISAQLMELAERHGTTIHSGEDISPDMLRRMQMRSQARQRAGRMVNNWMQQGRMPGMPVR